MASASKPPARRSRYTEAERERGLVALALFSGNYRRAAKALAADGLKIPPNTLYTWPQWFPEEYERVRTEVMPRIRAELAERHTELAQANVQVESEALELARKRMDGMEDRDLIALASKAAISSGVHTQRGSELRGEATTVVEHRSAKDIMKRLKDLGIDFIEGEAEEVKPDQLEQGGHE